MNKRCSGYLLVVVVVCLILGASEAACHKVNCNCTDPSLDSCATCTGPGCDCKCNTTFSDDIVGNAYVAVGLERQDAFQTYTVNVINGTHYISKWQFYVVCRECSTGIQVQTAEAIITSKYAHGNLADNNTDSTTPMNEFSSPYDPTNPPREDTLTIQIIGNMNAFWLFDGRMWYWRFTPTWSTFTPPPQDNIEPLMAPEAPEAPVDPPTNFAPVDSISPNSPSANHGLPKWAWALAILSIIGNILAILACISFRIYRVKTNHSDDNQNPLNSMGSDDARSLLSDAESVNASEDP